MGYHEAVLVMNLITQTAKYNMYRSQLSCVLNDTCVIFHIAGEKSSQHPVQVET